MFGPNDEGLQRPLQYKMYHGRRAICDNDGRELFLIDVVRPSREASAWIEEWGKAICDKFNNGHIPIVKTNSDGLATGVTANLYAESVKEVWDKSEKIIEEPTKRAEKRKRGRPRKIVDPNAVAPVKVKRPRGRPRKYAI